MPEPVGVTRNQQDWEFGLQRAVRAEQLQNVAGVFERLLRADRLQVDRDAPVSGLNLAHQFRLQLDDPHPLTYGLQRGADVLPTFGFELKTFRVRLDELNLVDQRLTVDQVLLFGCRLRLQHRRSHVAAMAAYRVRRHVEPVRDAVQHVAAQELAVDVDELRVRADRASAGH